MLEPKPLVLLAQIDSHQGLPALKEWVSIRKAEGLRFKISNVYQVPTTSGQIKSLFELWFAISLERIYEPLILPELISDLQWKSAVRLTPLLWGEKSFLDPQMPLPHPELHQNPIMLQCAAEVEPHVIHPILGQTLEDRLNDSGFAGLDFFAQGEQFRLEER